MAGLREFVVQFGAEEQCIEHLAGLRWPGGFACAGCGGRQAWRLKGALGCMSVRPATDRNRRPLERYFTGHEPI